MHCTYTKLGYIHRTQTKAVYGAEVLRSYACRQIYVARNTNIVPCLRLINKSRYVTDLTIDLGFREIDVKRCFDGITVFTNYLTCPNGTH